MSPKISVILSTFNHMTYLPRCINSILGQTFKDYEFIILNDGSTDNTEEYLKTLINDPRLVFITHQENMGIRFSYNEGLKLAQGDYISFIGSDDFFFPAFLEKLSEVLDSNSNAILTYSAFYWLNSKGETTGMNKEVYWGAHNLMQSSPGIASFMYRREVHNEVGFLRDIGCAADTDFWVRLSEKYGTGRIVYVPQPLCYFMMDETVDSYKRLESGDTAKSTKLLMDGVIERRERRRDSLFHRPRILFVTHTFPPRSYTGTELYAYNLAKGLIGEEYDVSVLYRVHDEPKLVKTAFDGIDIYNICSKWDQRELSSHYKNDEMERNFVMLLDQGHFDLIHFHHTMGLPFSLIDIAKRCGYPVCVSIHDFWYICPLTFLVKTDGTVHREAPETVDECVNCMKMGEGWNTMQLASTYFHLAYRLNYIREIFEKVDIITCASEYVKRIYREARIDDIVPRFELAPLGLPSGGPYHHPDNNRPLTFGFFGAIHPIKNVHMMVSAFKKVPGDIRLVIWGTGIDEYIKQIEIDDDERIQYKGPYTPRDLPRVFSSMDISIHPSLNESYSLTVRESLQAGVPVIVSGAEVYHEIQNISLCSLSFDSENGLVNAISRIAGSPRTMIQQMKEAIPKIRSIDKDVEEWNQRYKNLLK